MDKNKTVPEEQKKRTQFCSCKNSCQRKTGPKRAGCPCKDEGVYCSDQCECGTNVIVCRNNQHDHHHHHTSNRSCTDADLVSDLSKLQIIDNIDGEISHEETSCRSHKSTSITTDDMKQDTRSHSANKGKYKSTRLRAGVDKIDNGYALVIHNRYFNRLRPREGSEKDLDAIKLFCKKAGLTVDIKENLKVDQIREYCRKLTEDENKFDNYDGFVCFILSHGNSSGICGVYGYTISVQEIVGYFKESDDLLGKPKLFFIQACRAGGSVVDDGNESDQRKTLCPPDSSDILIAHSTIEGELSFRDIRTGSWFVQTLMKKLKAHAQSMHLMDIMTVVNEDIAGSELEGYRQMPIQMSTLTKFVYFKMATAAKVLEERASCLS